MVVMECELLEDGSRDCAKADQTVNKADLERSDEVTGVEQLALR